MWSELSIQKISVDILVSTVRTKMVATKHISLPQNLLKCFCFAAGEVSHTNRKHFIVGDPTAFPIVKKENKNLHNVPFPFHYVGPNLIQQYLGPPHTPSQTAAPTLEALSHADAVNSPLVTMASPKCAPKSTPFRRPIAKPHYPSNK